ncbi:glucosaminidase domain-containing protein [Patescibacteria group bacterium]|nr:glucosaminidase domain-containing protein [Patescibacteria group bacterium]
MTSMFIMLTPLIVSASLQFNLLTSSLNILPENQPYLANLQTFLEDRRSPLPTGELLKYSNWEMMVALSNAESGYGKHCAGDYNAWGIKDFRKGSDNFGGTRDFTSWAESVEYTSKLLYKYDAMDGEPTPASMVAKWKYVKPYDHWIRNVQYALNGIDNKVIKPAKEILV